MKMEGMISFAAGWCAADEVVMLRCVSISVLVVVKEWENKSILDDIDDVTWEVMSEDWNTWRSGVPARLCGRSDSSANPRPCLSTFHLSCFVIGDL